MGPAGRVAVLAADADARAVGPVDVELDRGVAQETVHGVERHLHAIDGPVALDGAVEHLGVDMHHHQRGIGTRVDGELLSSEVHHCVGAPMAERCPHAGLGVDPCPLGSPLEGGVDEGALRRGEEPVIAVAIELVVFAPLQAALWWLRWASALVRLRRALAISSICAAVQPGSSAASSSSTSGVAKRVAAATWSHDSAPAATHSRSRGSSARA